jgi:formylglycine-generating enzyme required for sulfatase activity
MVAAEEDLSVKESVGDILSGEDETAKIPAGEFFYGDEKEKHLIKDAYQIDLYPVTNQRFAEFIQAKGYEMDKYWSEKGWKWCRENKVSEPWYWQDEKWNQPDHPVVGVSWYEAQAFARWAGKALPTEVQWERTARGTDGREYPWKGEFDKEKCNTEESGIGKTSRVTRYPNGISPAGCYDMAGNVWEWTVSQDEYGDYILRGGCWNDRWADARCTEHLRYRPDERITSVGFRCVKTK